MEALKRFSKSKDDFKLTKVDYKRPSGILKGYSESGIFELLFYPKTSTREEVYVAIVYGRSFSYLKTSPILKIIDSDENSTTFETLGGVYKLEKI